MLDLTPELIAELQTMDTPTVCNALELLVPARRGYGYTVSPLVCTRPHLKPMVGFARKNGVIIGRSGGGSRHSNTLTFSPPLVITRAEIDRVIDVLDRGLTELGPQMSA